MVVVRQAGAGVGVFRFIRKDASLETSTLALPGLPGPGTVGKGLNMPRTLAKGSSPT